MRPEKRERNAELVAAYRAGLSMQQCAEGFGVSFSTVREILFREQYRTGDAFIRHLGPPKRLRSITQTTEQRRLRQQRYYARNKHAVRIARMRKISVADARKLLANSKHPPSAAVHWRPASV